MPNFIPTVVTPPATGPEDPRTGHLLHAEPDGGPGPWAAIIGFPCDVGVVRNSGRAGAAGGPEALRDWLYRFTPDDRAPGMRALLGNSRDLGDLVLSGNLSDDQARLGEAVGQVLADGGVPVVLGGGHETAHGHFLGYVNAGLDVAISNIDAHADVRELKDGRGHSGSPFRQALEHEAGRCKDYRVAGLQPQSVSAPHLAYLDERGCRHWFRDETDGSLLDALYPDGGNRYATFCLDALDAAFAPGVSAPAADGLAPAFWLSAAEHAGATAAVRSFDVVELNPRFDLDGRTARLAALTVWRFLRGLSTR